MMSVWPRNENTNRFTDITHTTCTRVCAHNPPPPLPYTHYSYTVMSIGFDGGYQLNSQSYNN